MDVPLEIKVELGSVRMTLREILDLHEGSLIQLNKLAVNHLIYMQTID